MCPVDVAEGMHRIPDITVDTGAGISVGNIRHFPHSQVEESPKKGQKYVNATGGISHNKGQMRPRLLLETGMLGDFTFQNTDDIQKPLMAMSDVNSKGHIGFCDGDQSFIILGNDKLVEELRKLVAKIQNKVPLHLVNGTFKLRAWQPEAPFGGQGR